MLVAYPGQVSASATSVELFPANTEARVRTIQSAAGSATLYVKMGATASTTSHDVVLNAGDYLEFPHPLYTGVVHGIWSAATGSCLVGEH